MYDIIIIGAGTAGIAAYKEAIKSTNNILIINDGDWDTTCARVGCMPSKILISVANRMHGIQHADDLALTVQSQIDTSTVMQHVRQLRNRFTRATLKDVNSWNPEHRISGQATFVNQNTVQVNHQQYQAKSFILAVGTTPIFDQQLKNEIGNKLITSDQIFELPQLPQSIAVIGSGVIALELAQALTRLNVETTIFARSRKVGSLTSPQLQTLAQEELSKELNIKFEILPNSIKKSDDIIHIEYTKDDINESITVEYVLAATGRQSNLGTIKLENIDEKFKTLKELPINPENKQLAQYPIFIVGDAHTTTPIQHEAANEGRLAVYNCLNYPNIQSVKILTPLGILFSQPQMATVGKSNKQLLHDNINFITGFVSYEKQGRAIVSATNQGAAELYVDKKSRKLIGAELFVDSAEHLAHLLSWIISEDLTIDEILQKPFYHPTLEEGLRTALKHARRQLDNN